MIKVILTLQFLCTLNRAQDYYYQTRNATRTTLTGLAAYRSVLTLDWLAAEDLRQRELVLAFETEPPPSRFVNTDCVTFPKPAVGKVSRLMLELLRNLEGDEGVIMPELIQVLVRAKLLMETSDLDIEPDFEALMETPRLMMGEPHSTFPRIVAVVWMLVTDPATTRKYGWCPVKQMNKYLQIAKPRDIAKQMKTLEVIIARGRFVMEEFIQNITPIHMYQRKHKLKNTARRANKTDNEQGLVRGPGQSMGPVHQLGLMQPPSFSPPQPRFVPTPRVNDESAITPINKGSILKRCPFCIPCVVLIEINYS